MATKSVGDMAPQELNIWLLEKGLDGETCILLTKDNLVDGKTFIGITESDLKSELGITKFGPKKTVLRLIEEAKEQDKEAPCMLCYSYDESQAEGGTSSDPDPEAAGVCAPYGTAALWKKSILKVHFTSKDGSTSIPVGRAWFIDNEPITTAKILDLANEWSANGRTCVPRFERASSKEDSDIRVKFETSGGSWSHIGSRAKKPWKDPSMVLNLGVGENDYKKYLVRHEFGHALGLGHEHQSIKAPIGLLDKKAVIDWLVKKGNMTKKAAEEKYHVDYERPHPKQAAIATEYDRESIMQYWIHPDWIDKKHDYAKKNPNILRSGINWPPQCTLSDIDQKAIVQLYRGMYHQSRSQVDSADFLDEDEPSGDSAVYSGVPTALHHPTASNGAPQAGQQSGGGGCSSSDGGVTVSAVKKGKDTVEYQNLLKSSGSLVPQLAAARCALTLANKLRAEELIPDSIYNAATSYGPGITEPSQIQAIIDAMLPKVERSSENYYTFLRILRDIDRDFAQLVEEGGSG